MSDHLPEAAASIVEAWNATVPVGTPVTLVKDLGERVQSRTKGPAYLMGGDPVVYVEGAGPWLLGRVIPNVSDQIALLRAALMSIRGSIESEGRCDGAYIRSVVAGALSVEGF